MKCPKCGREGQGRFCAQCGTALQSGGGHCAQCGAKLAAGARFCTSCGTATGPVARGSGNLGWYVTAAVLALLIVVIGVTVVLNRDDVSTGAPAAAAPMSGSGGSPPPLSGTPREQADRLFNRIMQARESGDTTQARFFLPMALQAYQAAGELDNDALFHLSMLHTFNGDGAAGLAAAQRILESNPDHLLGLAAAADAARTAGDDGGARTHWTRFLSVLETERVKPLPEYLDHSGIFPEYEAEARRFLGR